MFSIFSGLGIRAAVCAGLMLAALTSMSPARAQMDEAWRPQKSTTLIVPSNPGGGWDQTARFMQRAIEANKLSPTSVEVINRGGAGGTIGLTELVERHATDPYKLMVSGFGMTGSVLMHSSKHNIMSTTPLARLTSEYQAIAVPANSPFNSLDDLLTAFKANPQAFSWGGGSAGGSDHIFAYLLAEALDIEATKVNYVAFTGGGEASAALLGGQVDAGISGFGEWGGLADSGRIRLLAVSSDQRMADDDTPTFRELGIDLLFANWRTIVAAPGITRAQKEWYVDLLRQARTSDEWQETLKRNNWTDSFLTGEDFDNFIIADSARTARILQRVGISGDKGTSWAAVGPYLFPNIAMAGLIILAALIFWESRRNATAGAAPDMSEEKHPDTKAFVQTAAIIFAYILGLKFIGFIFVTPPVIVALSYLLGSRAYGRDIAVGLSVTALIVVIFEHLLNVDVP
jgi:putative tricarboxylic transport membrane protein